MSLQQHINQFVYNINIIEETISIKKWERAFLLYQLSNLCKWSDTNYQTWLGFLKIEFPNKNSYTLDVNKSHASKAHYLGYSWAEIEAIAEKTKYSNASRLMTKLQHKISVADFIQQANNPTKSTIKYIPNEHKVTFILSDNHVAKLEALLAPFGAGKGLKDRKYGFSNALMDYLDHVMP